MESAGSGGSLDRLDSWDGLSCVAVGDVATGSCLDSSGSWAAGGRDALEQLVDNGLGGSIVQHLEQLSQWLN